MYWFPSPQKVDSATPFRRNGTSDCRVSAEELHKAYRDNFPLFWEQIDCDVDKLGTIFEFFCAMYKLLIDAPGSLMKLLHQRLKARCHGGPPPIPFGFEAVIEHFAKAQMAGLSNLTRLKLLNPAFELFVTGSLHGLRSQHPQHEDKLPNNGHPIPVEKYYPEPDGAPFFYWAEFAFLAAYAGHDTDKWKEVLRVLIRAEKIYVCCYGQTVNGQVPKGIKFSTYDPRHFSRIHPDDAKKIPYPTGSRFDELENEATTCALFAFPGGIDV